MSSFLDQVQVINVANPAGGTLRTAAPPEPPAPPATPESGDAAMAELQAYLAKAQASVKAAAKSAKAKAKAEAEQARIASAKIAAEADSDKDGDESGVTTIQNGTNTVVVHHKKSSDDAYVAIPIVGMVFAFLIIRAVMAPFTQRAAARRAGTAAAPSGQGLTEDEQAILLKLQRTIGQMERRIESLETILIDETRTKEKYGTQH